MAECLLNTIAIFITAWLITKTTCCKNNRGELKLGKFAESGDITLKIGHTVYTARGFYKSAGKTLPEKLLRNMEKELDNADTVCYNINESQKGLDCKRERSIV